MFSHYQLSRKLQELYIDLNGEPLVVGDNHAPVKTFRAEGAGAPVVASHMNNSLNNGSESSETLPVVAGDAAAIKKQPSVHEIFEKIDQTVQAVRGSISTFQKDG